MKAWSLLAIIAAGSADAGQYTIGVIIFVSFITALFTSLIIARTYENSHKEKDVDSAGEVEKEHHEAVAPAKTVSSAVPGGVSDEIVAVIAASVAAMAPEGKQYRIKSVSRVRSQRPVWAAAGLAENTRPF